jgi:predicted Zn-dependent protease
MHKLKILLLLAVTVFSLAGCEPHSEAGSESRRAEPVPTAELLKQADNLFSQRTDVTKLRQAVSIISQARNPEQRNFEVESKFAAYSYFLSKQTTDEKESQRILQDGYTAGLIASRLEPAKPDGYFWAGANLGEQARRNPLTVGISSVDEIRQLMSKVVELEPAFQSASAFDALGQLELATRLTGGSAARAVEYLEKGIEYEKQNSYLRLHLAEAYLALDKTTEAKKQLDYIFQMNEKPEYAVEHREVLERAKKLLASRFNN